MRLLTLAFTCTFMLAAPAFLSRAMAEDDPYYAALDHRPRVGITVSGALVTAPNGWQCLQVSGLAPHGIGIIEVGDSICRIEGEFTANIDQFIHAVSLLSIDEQANMFFIDHDDGVMKVAIGFPVPAYLNDNTIPLAMQVCNQIYNGREFFRFARRRIAQSMRDFTATDEDRDLYEYIVTYAYDDERTILAANSCPTLDLP